mmetsp:Transcript_5583/g.13016  ORF Transcript_5583/g.13016 Transcript_5583/m.13016 type:complete len:379 (-) Transcript_5583:131-1267(-)
MLMAAHDPLHTFDAETYGGAVSQGFSLREKSWLGGSCGVAQGAVMLAPWMSGFVVAVPMEQAAIAGGAWIAPVSPLPLLQPQTPPACESFHLGDVSEAVELLPQYGAKIFMHDSGGALRYVGDYPRSENFEEAACVDVCSAEHNIPSVAMREEQPGSAKIFVHGSDGSLQHVAQCSPSPDGCVEVSVLGRPRMAAPAPTQNVRRADLPSRLRSADALAAASCAVASSDESTAAEPWWALGRSGSERQTPHSPPRETSSTASSTTDSPWCGSQGCGLSRDTASTPSIVGIRQGGAASDRSSLADPVEAERHRPGQHVDSEPLVLPPLPTSAIGIADADGPAVAGQAPARSRQQGRRRRGAGAPPHVPRPFGQAELELGH